MIRRKEQRVSDAVLAFLRESGLETPLLQYRVVQSWRDVVGEPFASHSEALEVKGEVLWVKVHSPSLATELQMQRTALTARLNAAVGAQIIKDIRMVV